MLGCFCICFDRFLQHLHKDYFLSSFGQFFFNLDYFLGRPKFKKQFSFWLIWIFNQLWERDLNGKWHQKIRLALIQSKQSNWREWFRVHWLTFCSNLLHIHWSRSVSIFWKTQPLLFFAFIFLLLISLNVPLRLSCLKTWLHR